MKKLKVGIAGYGVVGRRRKICVDNIRELEVTCICDKSFEKENFYEHGVKTFVSYNDLLKENLDILFVCLPNDLAATVTISGLKKGLHVFCEKPPGRSVEEIIKVCEVEKNFPDLKLMYGFNHRYHDSVIEALKVYNSGLLGKVINIRALYGKSKLITFNQPDWRKKRDVAGGGVLLDQGIHIVDLIRLFAGEFEKVYSFVENSHWGYEVEDNAYALMKSKTGIVAMVNSSATQWRHEFKLEITLEKGSLILGGILSGSKSYGAETLKIIYADTNKDNGDPKEVTTKYNVDMSWDYEVQEFCRCIFNNKKIISSNSMDALQTMKLVYKIYCADENWRTKFSIPYPSN